MIRKAKRAVYNEPLPVRTGDVFPKTPRVALQRIGATVRARLTLERKLRLVCGLAKPEPSIARTAHIRRLLLTMLDESDSPLSASLRARAAALAGPFGLRNAAPKLGRIAADESEDLATRLGAVQSYFSFSEERGAAVLRKVLASKTWQVRACAYVEVLNSGSAALREVAFRRLETERDTMVSYVRRFAPSAFAASSTTQDAD
jgi:hypothetical protein